MKLVSIAAAVERSIGFASAFSVSLPLMATSSPSKAFVLVVRLPLITVSLNSAAAALIFWRACRVSSFSTPPMFAITRSIS